MKAILRSGYLAFAILALTACTGDRIRANSMLIGPGDSREAVIAAMGPPENRTFRGSAEAWQYCSTGLTGDTYRTVWLVNGKVASLTSRTTESHAPVLCAGFFPEVDWGQVPPDVRIAIEIG